jgi:hypothetical protein
MQFDHAQFETSAPKGITCHVCTQSIPHRYWQFAGQPTCETCRDGVLRAVADAGTSGAFGRAALRAGLVALACGVGYAIFVGVTNIELALLTIGIGFLVGNAVQKVTRGFGTRRYQVLAVALTYLAVTMGYAVPVVRGLRQAATHETRDHSAPPPATSGSIPPAAEPVPPEAPDAPATSSAPAPPKERPGLGTVFFALAVVVVLCLLAPFLGLTQGAGGLLSLAIIAFALHEAWRRSRGITPEFTGPHTVQPSWSTTHEPR